MRKGGYHGNGKSKVYPGNERTDGKYVLKGNKSATKVSKELGIDTNTAEKDMYKVFFDR